MKLYILVRNDLKVGLAAAQALHGAIAYGQVEPFIGDQPTVVILSADT